MKILVIDVGGNNIKLSVTGEEEIRKLPSGPELTPTQLVAAVNEAVREWDYEAISLGVPAPVQGSKLIVAPVNLGPGWMDVNFATEFGKPVKLINDAAMQALGSYEGGRMLFLGLGTGLGSAMIAKNVLVPLELAHLPYKKRRTFEDYAGDRGLERLGKKKWTKTVCDIVDRLRNALVAESVVLGGGNVKKLQYLPDNVRLGDNRNAILGGFRLWDEAYKEF